MNLSGIADALIEAPIVTSFTRLGYEARRRLAAWTPLDDYDLTGRVIVITGGTSGLGYAAAEQFARCGATLVIVGRTDERNERAVAELTATTGNSSITQVPADMGDLEQVRHLAERLLADHDRLDVLIHNAGALDPERRAAPDGTEATVASQVVGPFLLTSLLLDRLAASAPARVLTMSSGGMYATGLTVSGLEMTPEDYNGTEQYARAKRAQVTLNEMWAERYGDRGITFHAPRCRLRPPDLREGDGSVPADARARRRHPRLARCRRHSARVERPLLARPCAAPDPQAPDDEADRQRRTARATLEPGHRHRQRQKGDHVDSRLGPEGHTTQRAATAMRRSHLLGGRRCVDVGRALWVTLT
jgi:dehydrogenase/reductase SDR family member 12